MRVASQLTFCTPGLIIPRGVVERNDDNIITRIFSLDGSSVESAHTLFYDGILSAGILSIKRQLCITDNESLISDYQYFDIQNQSLTVPLIPSEKPLIIDFGSDQPEIINSLLPHIAPILIHFSIFDVIAACCYFPALLLGKKNQLSVDSSTELLLWEKTNLVEKRITAQTRISTIKPHK